MSSYPPPNSNYTIYNSANFTYSTDSLTIETADSRYLKLTGSIASGLQTLNGGVSVANIYNSGNTFTVPSSSGQLALVSQIPSLSSYATLNGSETVQNKTLQASSNTGIASFTATTITTSFAHNLLVGDVISFPYIGSMTGIVVSTNYTIDTTPSTTQFTMNGITSMGGTVNNAYYVLITRATSNESSNGGVLRIVDPSNTNNGLYFDVSGSTVPNVVKFQASASALPINFPSFGGTVAMLNNTQTFTGSKTFSLQLACTRTGQTSSANAPLLIQPASTAMTGSNSYFWTYFSTPTTTGSSTGIASTVTIQGAPSVAASNNYAFRIIGGQTSLPNGTVSAPSIVFSTGNNTSGIYSSGANVINTAISGSLVQTINSTGLTISGITQSSTSMITPILRPVTGNQILSCPNVNLGTGTAQLLITPSSAGWSTGGVSELDLGDNNHYIRVTNGSGMEINSFNNIKLGSQGNPFRNLRYGSTSYSVSLSSGSSVDVSVTFGVTLVSVPTVVVSLTGASGSSFWQQCNVGASAITTTGFDATIRNDCGNSTSGTVNISYIAFNV